MRFVPDVLITVGMLLVPFDIAEPATVQSNGRQTLRLLRTALDHETVAG